MKSLLIYRLIIVNVCGISFLVWAWSLGYVQQVFKGDVSHISYVISVLFFLGLLSTFRRAFKVSRAMDENADYLTRKQLQAKAAKMPAKNAHIADIIEWLVLLGLIGNVVGFLLALAGADVSSLNTPEGTQKLAGQLLAGLGVAFYTTLAGTVFALWTSVNYRMLETATSLYIEDCK